MKKLTPMVAMNRVSGDWPTSDRSTARSTTKATATSRSSVIRPARYQGSPSLRRPAKFRAAKNTIAPWA